MVSNPPMPAWFGMVALIATLVGAAMPRPVSAEMQRWVVDSTKSRVWFDAFHSFGNFTGTSEAPVGEIEADIADLKQPMKGAVTVAATTLKTGKKGRDKELWRALDAEHHAEIRYRIERVESSFPTLGDNTDVLLTIHGVLSMRGVERPMMFMGRLRQRHGSLWVRGENRLSISDYAVPPLRSWLVSMQDSVLASFDLTLSKNE
jgi:polyisoprenoid-binding protein YceI